MVEAQQLLADLTAIAERDALVWNESAQVAQIVELETSLGIELPADYKSVLAWHDGTDDREFCSVIDSEAAAEDLLELWLETLDDEELDAGERNIEPGTGRVRDGDFVKGWVPFYDYGTGAFDCLDCQPGPLGRHGQVIHYDPDGVNAVTHASIREWASERARD